MKINDYLNSLNKEYYKSKNQFIAEALLYYIDALESGKLYEESNTNAAWEQIREDAIKDMVPIIEKKVMNMLGNFMGGMSGSISILKANESDDNGFVPDEELAGVSNLFVD
jgi:hypothetical protein